LPTLGARYAWNVEQSKQIDSLTRAICKQNNQSPDGEGRQKAAVLL